MQSPAPGLFGDLAVRKGWISYARLEEGLAELFAGKPRTAERLGGILKSKGYLTPEQVGQLFAELDPPTPEVRCVVPASANSSSDAALPPSAPLTDRLDVAGEHRSVDAPIPSPPSVDPGFSKPAPFAPSAPPPPPNPEGQPRPPNPILAEFWRNLRILLLVNAVPLAGGLYLWLMARSGEIVFRDPGPAFFWHLPQLAAACILLTLLCWIAYPLSRRKSISLRPMSVILAIAACSVWAIYALTRIAITAR